MTVYIDNFTGYSAVVRCDTRESEAVSSTPEEHGFTCLEPREIDGVPNIVRIHLKSEGRSWSQIDLSELRKLLEDSGAKVPSDA